MSNVYKTTKKEAVSTPILRSIYITAIFFSALACFYSFFKPGISKPSYPAAKIRDSLQDLGGAAVISSTRKHLDNDSSDRKFSDLYQYKFKDGSEVLAVLVRVRKQGDFKIEGYGLLTKNVDPIYLDNPIFSESTPYSMVGSLSQRKALQTCIVPSTTRIDQADVRLSPLTSVVRKMSGPRENKLWSKVLGREAGVDYSCLVITYLPPAKFATSATFRIWSNIVEKIQQKIHSD